MRSGQMVADRYRLEELIGSGGMGVVWRGTDTELDRVVAIKHAKPGDGTRGAEQLRREAKNAAKVHHRNAVTLFDAVREGAEVWLIMEYVPGESLAAILERDGPRAPEEAARIGAQIADALSALHINGIVHRDVKPGNVLVTGDGVAKLTDFGVARWSEETLTQTGPVAGTPAYMAPELAAGGREASPASDVFSLGATLFAAVEDPIRNAGPFGRVLDEMLAPLPRNRPSAAHVRASLAAVATGTTIPEPPARRTHTLLPKITIAAVVVALIAGGWYLVSTKDPETKPTAAAPRSLVGDPRTADPCSLLDPVALGKFGQSYVDPDYGAFNRCDVMIEISPGDSVDVKLTLEKADAPANPGPGGVTGIDRFPGDIYECDREIRLGEPFRVQLVAKSKNPTKGNLCAISDSATESAAAILGRGEIARRAAPVDRRSLFTVDSCALLDGKALARIPGVDAIHPDAGYVNWECRWHSTTGPTELHLLFDRNLPLTAEDGRPIKVGGHDAFVAPEGDGPKTCWVQIVNRQYFDENANLAVELLIVIVSGDQPVDELCAMATDVATPAAARLPK